MRDSQRLLIVAPDFHPRTGGYAHAVTNLASVLAAHMPVTVLCSIPLDGSPEIDVDGLEVVRRTAPGWQLAAGAWGASASRWVGDRVREGDIRAVLLETAESPLLGLRTLRLDVPVLLRVHAAAETELAWHARPRPTSSGFVRSILRTCHYAMMRRLIRRAPVILSTSQYHLDFVKRVALAGSSVEISRRSFYVLPNVVLEAQRVLAEQMLPAHLTRAAEGRFLLTLGRLDEQGVEQKGFRDLLQAFSLARRHDQTLADVTLIVAGGGSQRAALEQYAQALGLGSAVVFSGPVPHDVVVSLTKRAQAVVLLSRYEGQAMFALESLALGAPLVLTETGGLIGLVEQEKNGVSVPTQDIPAAAQALKHVLHLPRDQMSAQSARLFRVRFAPERVVSAFLDILHVVAPSATASNPSRRGASV